MSDVLHKTDAEILELVRQLCIAYKLKRTPRYGAKRDLEVHSESVGEHIFALHYLATYFMITEIVPCPLNSERVHNLITFHDFGEIPGGDKPYKFKTRADEAQECKDAKFVFSQLPIEIRELAERSWEEYERRETLEAQFVYALDKVEPCFELFGPYERALIRLGYTYQEHVGKKFRATKNFPLMRRIVDVTARDKVARGIFDLPIPAE